MKIVDADFGTALQMLQKGVKVSRKGWKGVWLSYVPSDQWGLGEGQAYDSAAPGAQLLPWIGLRSVEGTFSPWFPSQTEMLARDWHTLD